MLQESLYLINVETLYMIIQVYDIEAEGSLSYLQATFATCIQWNPTL